MKELSIEEKAQRYDEILARAKGASLPYYKEDIMSKVKEFVDYLLPELKESKESEEERIRKNCIHFLELQKQHHAATFEIEECIAWLEKQGEKKSKFRAGDTIKCKYDDRQFTIKSVDLDKGIYTYTQEGCGNDIDYADEEFD